MSSAAALSARATDTRAAVSIEHLSKRFGRTVAVEDLTLAVAPGEVFGFLGPNGAGKSTTIRDADGVHKMQRCLTTGSYRRGPANGSERRWRAVDSDNDWTTRNHKLVFRMGKYNS
jgi:ABC-type phosphate/phosphonate transport system ATPase subunit